MRYWIKLIIVALMAGTVFYWIHFKWGVSAQDIRTFILSYGWLSPVIFWLLYTLGPLIFFPSSLLSITAGLTYGIWPGVFYIWIGACGAAVTGYGMGHFFGQSVIKLQSFEKARLIQEKVEKRGFFYVLILRLIPLVGFDLLCYISGMSKVRFPHYMAATMIGIIPGTLAYTLVGTSFTSGNTLYIFLAFLPLTLLIGGSYLFRSRVRHWLGFYSKEK